ncbi:UNVERIFIED_CONTAM: hypothetical protein FKN15_000892 [Acipenser sinensis]
MWVMEVQDRHRGCQGTKAMARRATEGAMRRAQKPQGHRSTEVYSPRGTEDAEAPSTEAMEHRGKKPPMWGST